MKNKLKTGLIALAIVSMFFAGYTFAGLTATKTLPTTSTVITDVNLSVYDAAESSTEIVSIDWGTLLPTESKTFSLWVQNDAAINMSISITTQNWNPTYAEESINFTYSESLYWYGHYPILTPGQRAGIKLKITAGDNPPSGDFSFDVVITGTTI